MYHDGILCAIYHDREIIFGQNTPFLECYVITLFLSSIDLCCIMSEHKWVRRLLVA